MIRDKGHPGIWCARCNKQVDIATLGPTNRYQEYVVEVRCHGETAQQKVDTGAAMKAMNMITLNHLVLLPFFMDSPREPDPYWNDFPPGSFS